MRKILAFVVAIALTAMIALLVAPSLVDWNHYRGQIASVLGEATGRRVSIDGDLDLALLPSPRLTARDLRVANIGGAVDPELIRVVELHLRVGIADLLRGRLVLTRLSLVEPVLALETTADGRASWDFAPDMDRDGGAAQAPGGAVGLMPVAISVDHVDIAGGTVTWRRAGGTAYRITDLHGQLTAGGPDGPFRGQARLRYRDVPATFTVTTGRLDRDRFVPASGTVQLTDGSATLAWTVRLRMATGEADGTVKLDAPDAMAMLHELGIADRAHVVSAGGLSAESKLRVADDVVAFPDMTVRLGDTSGSGEATVRLGELPELTARIEFPVLDLDSLIESATGARGRNGEGAADLAAGPSNLPAVYRARIDLTAGTIRLRKGLVRDARLSMLLAQGVLTVRDAAARLPGGTDISISGRAEPGPGGLVFNGELAAAADNIRAALVWAGADDRMIPADRLRGFSYTSRISVTPEVVQLTDITARLDATRMTGGATIARRRRPSFGLRLILDRLNLDDYLEPSRGVAAGRFTTDPNGRPANRGLPAFDAFDANFDLLSESLTWHGETARRVRLSGTIVRGVATLDRIAVDDVAGASIVVSGRISGLADTPSVSLDVTADGKDPVRAARLLGFTDAGAARRIGPFGLKAQIEGTRIRASVKGTLSVLGGRVAGEGYLTDAGDGTACDLDISIALPEGDRVLAVLAPDRVPTGIGPVSGRLKAIGSARALSIRSIDGRIGDATVAGDLDADLSGDRPRIAAVLTVGKLALDRFLPDAKPAPDTDRPAGRGSARWSRETLGLSALRDFDLDLRLALESLTHDSLRVDEAELRASLAHGVLTVDRFAGHAFGGRIDSAGIIDVTGAEPRLTARLEGAGLEARTALGELVGFDRLTGPLAISFDGSAAGDSEYALVSSLAGKGSLAGTVRARLTGEERAKAGVAGLVGSLLGEKVREFGAAGDALTILLEAFADAPATLDGDIVAMAGRAHTENLRLRGRGAEALTVGDADLANWTIGSTTTLRREADADQPYMIIELEGPLDAPNIRSGGTWLRRDEPVAPPKAPPDQTGSGTGSATVAPGAGSEPGQPRQSQPPQPDQFILDVLRTLAE